MSSLLLQDKEIYEAVQKEIKRQKETICLIASENYTSKAVMEVQASVLANKYSEGYPGQRYYGGCENMDSVECVAIERAKQLFHAEFVNVQPHSGAQANMAVYFALINPGDTVMGMSLAHGGHLTHGSPANFSGRFYNYVHYGLNPQTERIDYDQVEKLALKHNPRLIFTGASAYPRIIDFERFRKIADQVGAKVVTDMAHIAGLVAAGVHPSPVPYSDLVTSTTHKSLRGPRSGFILGRNEYAHKIDASVFPRVQGGPLMHIVAAKAVCFKEALQPDFLKYQLAVINNAMVLASELEKEGIRLVSGGTDNHLMLADLTRTGVSGLDAQLALEEVNIVANRNAVPFDTRPPKITSGLRFGTPAATSRGFGPAEMKQIAAWIVKVISNIGDQNIKKQIKEEVMDLCGRFPVPGIDY
ncbi:MAG TPA: serine hydroxymethyltransferase [Dehalococcoidales bacterium]|nr:serine hydroxymethyltransferase [Dehalococcoidales bacterium]